MACDSCAKRASRRVTAPVTKLVTTPQVIQNNECGITMDQLLQWKDKLVCFKEKHLYKKYNVSPQTLNRHLGNVLTAINLYWTRKCYLENKVEEISIFLLIVESSNKC